MVKSGLFITSVLVVVPAFAQVKNYGRQPRSTTPLRCEQQTIYRHFCESLEVIAVTKHGGVVPSRTVLVLPDLFTDESKKLGYACGGGYAMRRIKGGWKQINDREYKPVRCRTP